MVRIYGTMGPSCEADEVLKNMLINGMNGIRMNLSHASPDECRKRAEKYRKVCEELQVPCEIVLDLKGPETRIGWLKKQLHLFSGDTFVLKSKTGRETLPVISVPPAIVNNVNVGDRLLMHDGIVCAEVAEELEPEYVEKAAERKENAADPETERADAGPEHVKASECSSNDAGAGKEDPEDRVHCLDDWTGGNTCISGSEDPAYEIRKRFLCRIIYGGIISSQQSVQIMGREIDGPILSRLDLEALDLAPELGITGVMLSFVRSGADVREVRAALAERNLQVKVFSKIETLSGMEHLNEIMEQSDVIIIARGDLGNAMPIWKLPGAQKRIAGVCRKAGKPFMVATQMLQSMTGKAVPTRAEVLDIYNAVMDGADYVMVTGETAVGKYPVEVMGILSRTVREAEQDLMSGIQ
ncbi:MAG: hypothetical protein IJ242_10580 [Clostridia bacterium]|nr:hypothetical protein [Clostridia bacterium]